MGLATTILRSKAVAALTFPQGVDRYLEQVNPMWAAHEVRARVVDATTESFTFEMTGAGEKLDAFIALMRPLGLAEVSRTGVAAIARWTAAALRRAGRRRSARRRAPRLRRALRRPRPP